MGDIDINAARALCDATTPGPWVVGSEGLSGVFFGTLDDPDDPSEPGILLGEAGSEVVEFIVAARTLVPALLDEVERIEQQLGWSVLALLDRLSAAEARTGELEATVQRMEAEHVPVRVDGDELCAFCSWLPHRPVAYPCLTLVTVRGSDV